VEIKKAIITAAGRNQRTLPLQTLQAWAAAVGYRERAYCQESRESMDYRT